MAVQVDLSQPDFWAAVDSTGHGSRAAAWLGGFTEGAPAQQTCNFQLLYFWAAVNSTGDGSCASA